MFRHSIARRNRRAFPRAETDDAFVPPAFTDEINKEKMELHEIDVIAPVIPL